LARHGTDWVRRGHAAGCPRDSRRVTRSRHSRRKQLSRFPNIRSVETTAHRLPAACRPLLPRSSPCPGTPILPKAPGAPAAAVSSPDNGPCFKSVRFAAYIDRRRELIHIRTRRKSPGPERRPRTHLRLAQVRVPVAPRSTTANTSACADRSTSTPKPATIVRPRSQPSPKPCQLRDAAHLNVYTRFSLLDRGRW